MTEYSTVKYAIHIMKQVSEWTELNWNISMQFSLFQQGCKDCY